MEPLKNEAARYLKRKHVASEESFMYQSSAAPAREKRGSQQARAGEEEERSEVLGKSERSQMQAAAASPSHPSHSPVARIPRDTELLQVDKGELKTRQ